jgi:[ribosomal protein S18]-alanine N-acetyltransferase
VTPSENPKETESLRPATEDDLPQILEIERAAHQAPWGQPEFEAELSKPYSQFLVLSDDETDSKVMGYIVFWLMFDECNILNVVVDLPYRGTGLAKKMIRQAVNAAVRKGIRKVLLEVRKSNQAAIQLYQSMRFAVIHVRKGFYSNGEDAYQMALYLDGPNIEF